MRIVITRWGLDSYLDLLHRGVLDAALYRRVLRPDILLLRERNAQPKFKKPKFWGPAIDLRGRAVGDGWKMKWHNFGPHNVQLRLCIALIEADSYLCHAYVKNSGSQDKRMAASLKDKIQLIRRLQHDERGEL
ncbi:MAG: hypothetical protein GXP55_06360 [Deltaproteobacteria bacterium]|nr:hypothetical protein [Deltaproteobacteria bacterium]